MDNDFIDKKDRIVTAAIEIISESGLGFLNTRKLAEKVNISEAVLYRYFGSIDEVLLEVIETYSKNDREMIATVEDKDISHIDKIVEFLMMLVSYYADYQEMTAIVLNYESFLHNANTRDKLTECSKNRYVFLMKEFEAAIDDGEICDVFTPEELCLMVTGTLLRDILNRRMANNINSHEQIIETWVHKFVNILRIQ